MKGRTLRIIIDGREEGKRDFPENAPAAGAFFFGDFSRVFLKWKGGAG
ncbi:MAG: hypothetical protein LLG93_15930 [Deltaproteobacteria bacterium]|nr:hypothetical protein [Deltaproteobacteria bacterium]